MTGIRCIYYGVWDGNGQQTSAQGMALGWLVQKRGVGRCFLVDREERLHNPVSEMYF